MTIWTASDIPSQRGRTVVVTGTGGLGFQCALALAGAGANVVIAGRSASKGASAVEQIRQRDPRAQVSFESLDLASLDSIEAFGKRLRNSLRSLDLLINNAAVMTPPRRMVTADGFELQLGTNYLGHFALTAQLLPLLGKSDQPRVVSVSSVAARDGAIDFDDLQSERRYKPMVAYSQSKLACLMFAFEFATPQHRRWLGHPQHRRSSRTFAHRSVAQWRRPMERRGHGPSFPMVSVPASRAGRVAGALRSNFAAGTRQLLLRPRQA